MRYMVKKDILGTMIILDDKMWIPCDPGNSDYQKYLAWLDEGNEPEEWIPPASREQ